MSQTEQTAAERSTINSTFVIERTYGATPQQVFAAWADPAAKAQWFGPPEKPEGAYSMEFRVGGAEHLSVPTPDGKLYRYDAVYQDIVPGYRIVYSYDMHCDDVRISVSLAVVEIEADGDGSRLTLTEHGAYLDGLDTPAQREHGTIAMIDSLGRLIQGAGDGL